MAAQVRNDLTKPRPAARRPIALAESGWQHSRMPKISVLIPTYNCGRFIEESIASALNQTRQPDEIVVVDDGSTDDTEAVVGRITDPRVRYVRKTNGGESSARNRCLDESTGEYIAFLDADDRWRPNKLELQCGVMDAHPELVYVFGNFERFDHATGKVYPQEQFHFYPELRTVPARAAAVEGAKIIEGDAFLELVRFYDVPAFCQAMIYRRSALAGQRFDESLRICPDLTFALHASLRGPVGYTLPVVVEVRRHDTNLTHDYTKLSIPRLKAYQAIDAYVISPRHRAAYLDRIVRAMFDAARAQRREGEIREAVGLVARAWRVRGGTVRKFRSSIGLLRSLAFGR